MNARRAAGFTLIELIVALTISTIIVGFVATFLAVPVQAHLAQSRRAELAASAEDVARSLARDVRGALPNSLRVGVVNGRPAAEMIAVAGVAIYRDVPAVEGDFLRFDAADDQFDVLGLPAAASHVVVNNRGVAGADAYALGDVIAPAAVDPLSSTIQLNPAVLFPAPSPHRRVFLVSPPGAVIRYECDLVGRTLRRYAGQAINGVLGALPAGTPFTVVARDVTACTFTRSLAPIPPLPARPEHGGVLHVQVTISRAVNGGAENVRVMKYYKVENAA
jgi:MSHA biogenesis protein MshO